MDTVFCILTIESGVGGRSICKDQSTITLIVHACSFQTQGAYQSARRSFRCTSISHSCEKISLSEFDHFIIVAFR